MPKGAFYVFPNIGGRAASGSARSTPTSELPAEVRKRRPARRRCSRCSCCSATTWRPWTGASFGAIGREGSTSCASRSRPRLDDLRRAWSASRGGRSDRDGIPRVRPGRPAAVLTIEPGDARGRPSSRSAPRRGIYVDRRATCCEDGTPRSRRRSSRRLRDVRPRLPLALRAALQLRADVGPPGRLDLVGPVRRRRCCSTRWTTTSRDPDRADADIISYAAGHKALGLYAMWALRNEIARIGAPELLPHDERRAAAPRGPARLPAATRRTTTPLFRQVRLEGARRPPDAGHAVRQARRPAPRASASPSSLGPRLRRGRLRTASDAPRVHIVEGEGGMTPGRVAEALAAAGTASLGNVDPARRLEPGVDRLQPRLPRRRPARRLRAVGPGGVRLPPRLERDLRAGRDRLPADRSRRSARALAIDNGQPTAIVYRTVKGWQYGIEGRASHGAGHKLCADGFYERGRRRCSRAAAADAPALRARTRSAAAAGRTRRSSRSATGTRCRSCAASARDERGRRRHAGRAAARGRARAARRAQRARRAPTRRASRRSTRPRERGAQPPPSWSSRRGRLSATLRGELGRVARPLQPAERRRDLRRGGRPARLDQRQRGRRRVSRRASTTRRPIPTRATLSIGGICEDAHDRRALRASPRSAATSASARLRRVPRAARPHRRAAARHRQPGAAGGRRRARTSRSSWSAPTPGSRPARTARRTPTRSRCSCCRRTSRRAR